MLAFLRDLKLPAVLLILGLCALVVFAPKLGAGEGVQTLLQILGVLTAGAVNARKSGSTGKTNPPPPPSDPPVGGLVAGVLFAVCIAGCAVFTPRNVLDASKVACVMQSYLFDSRELAKICDIADELTPTIRELVSMREAANKAGVKYGDVTSHDAGPDQ